MALISIHERGSFPARENFAINGRNQTIATFSISTDKPTRIQGTSILPHEDPRGWSAGGAVVRWDNIGGRPSQRSGGLGIGYAMGNLPYAWIQQYDPTRLNPGARVHGAEVAVFDVHLMISTGTVFPGGEADTTGFFFIPMSSADAISNVSQYVPGGASGGNSGGFGVFLQNVGGNAGWCFLIWDGSTILRRVALPVPDVTKWSTFRFIITSATPTALANLRCIYNENEEINQDFDGVNLLTPSQIFSASSRFMPGFNHNGFGDAGSVGMHLAFDYIVGNPITAGSPIQAPTVTVSNINDTWATAQGSPFVSA